MAHMKVKQLLEILMGCDMESEVSVKLNQPSVGPTAKTGVSSLYQGFDWDNGNVIIKTDDFVVTDEFLTKSQKYSRSYEKLLYFYAMENDYKFNGISLMGSVSTPKGTTTRVLKEYMKRDVEEYLVGNINGKE